MAVNGVRRPGTENELEDCRRAGAVCSKYTNIKCKVELQIVGAFSRQQAVIQQTTTRKTFY